MSTRERVTFGKIKLEGVNRGRAGEEPETCIKVFIEDGLGNALWATGSPFPPAGQPGFAIGCWYFDPFNGIYYNNGTESYCNFEELVTWGGA